MKKWGMAKVCRISQTELPNIIREYVGNQKYEINNIGMSESEVRIYDKYVLKIQPESVETDNEYSIVNWLNHCIPIPSIPVYYKQGGRAYTLMTKIDGDMLCAKENLANPEMMIKIVTTGLKMLWKIDVNECPYITSRLDERLKVAEYNVVNGLVDVHNVEPETFGSEGFKNPKELLEWLKCNRPEEDIVLTHGDFCLPNIFVKDGSISGFIDLGKMGPADRWQDIAIAIRSLEHNFNGKYTDGKKIYDFKPQMLIDELGIAWDEKKYRYYILLDELF